MTFRTHRCQETSSPGGADKVHVVRNEERECLLTGANLENVQYTSVAQHQPQHHQNNNGTNNDSESLKREGMCCKRN